MARHRPRSVGPPHKADGGDFAVRGGAAGAFLAPGDDGCVDSVAGGDRNERLRRSPGGGGGSWKLFGVLPATAGEEGGHVCR